MLTDIITEKWVPLFSGCLFILEFADCISDILAPYQTHCRSASTHLGCMLCGLHVAMTMYTVPALFDLSPTLHGL